MMEPPSHACEYEHGCNLPGRFVIGIDGGARRYWCIDHTEEGMRYFDILVLTIREAIGRTI